MRRRVLWLVLLGLSGCGEDKGLRIVIDDGGDGLDGQIERVVLTLVASQTDPMATNPETNGYLAYTCNASQEVFEGERLAFPLVVTVHRGERFAWECVALRIQGFVGAEEVYRTEELFCTDLENTSDEVQIYLQRECLGFDCVEGEICSFPGSGEPSCGVSEVHRIFEIPPAVNDDCA